MSKASQIRSNVNRAEGGPASTAALVWVPVKSFKIDGPALVIVTGDGATLRPRYE
jgi:hypothetical protein